MLSQVLQNNGVYTIKSLLSGKYLDIAGGASGNCANVQQYAGNNTLAQCFIASWKGNGWYTFINFLSGKVLDVANGSSKSGSNVQQYSANGSDAQLWGLVKNADGSYRIVSKLSTNRALDVSGASKANGANIQIYSKNGTAAQNFRFYKQNGLTSAYALSNKKPVSSGEYFIDLGANSKFAVDVNGASTANGANIQLYGSNESAAQKFKISYLSNGLYYLTNSKSGKVVEVKYGSTANAANVWQYDYNKTQAQYWYITKNSDGSYSFTNAGSNLRLSLASNTLANGTNINQRSAGATKYQSFKLADAPLICNGTYVMVSNLVQAFTLDVSNGSNASGANVQIFRSNGSNAQKWTFTHLGNNIYKIINKGSGKALDVNAASKSNGANVQQYSWNNTNAQKWRAVVNGGTVMLQNVASGKYLDVSTGEPVNGQNVQQYSGNWSRAQQWRLEDESWTFYTGLNSEQKRFVNKIEQYNGWPYVWGGSSPSTSFDCSGFVSYVINSLGWGSVGRPTAESLFYGYCYEIAPSQARVGDIVFYRGTYSSDVNFISHVVFYVGRGVMYGAGDPISYCNVNEITNIYGRPASVIYARLR